MADAITDAFPAPDMFTQVAAALILSGTHTADAACTIAREAANTFGDERCDDEQTLSLVLDEMGVLRG
jgi:hypothetical protein